MADHAAEGGDDNDVFVYMGGNQVVPRDVTHAIVDPSVDTIRRKAFSNCRHLVYVEMHDGVKIIEVGAFEFCWSLIGINLLGVRVIESDAFADCRALEDVEFGNKLDKIGSMAFRRTFLGHIKIPKVREIRAYAFANCEQLTDADLSEDLQSVGNYVFWGCPLLRRIALPLKDGLFYDSVFNGCHDLSTVDLVGGIHKTISSLLLESWRDEMNKEIDRINQTLPNTYSYNTTALIEGWILRILRKVRDFKAEHYLLLKEAISLLELALWKANLINNGKEEGEHPAKKAKIIDECGDTSAKAAGISKEPKSDDVNTARRAARVTCGADIIIKNVLPFLNDNDEFPLRNHVES